MISRICIDTLRSRAARPEVSIDQDLPELVVTDDRDTPEDAAVLSDSVGLALLVVLGSLRPDERLAFVLHDMFAVPFAEIGAIIGKSTEAAKMAASRARRKVQDVPAPAGIGVRSARSSMPFWPPRRAATSALLQVLDPDVTWRQHTVRGVTVTTGSSAVLEAVRRGQGRASPRAVSWSTASPESWAGAPRAGRWR